MNLDRMQTSAKMMIQKSGGTGYLVRGAVKRTVIMARFDIKPTERGLYLEASEIHRVAAKGVVIAPDFEQDTIQFNGKRYKIVMEPKGPNPDGNHQMYWDCPVLYIGTV